MALDACFYKAVEPLYFSGMGTENVAPLLYSLIRTTRPQRLLEVGLGYTTPFMAQGLKDNIAEFEADREVLGNPQGDEELSWLENGLAWSHADLLHRRLFHAPRAGDAGRRVQDDDGRDSVGAGGSVAEVAAQGGAALDLGPADDGGGIDEAGVGLHHRLVTIDTVAGDRRTQPQALLWVIGEFVGLGNVLDVY